MTSAQPFKYCAAPEIQYEYASPLVMHTSLH